MNTEEEVDKEIEEWMNDKVKRMDNDDPWLVSLEPVIDDIVKTKNIDEIEKKVLVLEQRFHEGQGLLNSIKKIILQAFVIELKSNMDKVEKERVKNAIIKLFGFDMI